MPKQNASLGRTSGFPVAPSNVGKEKYDLADVMAESPMLGGYAGNGPTGGVGSAYNNTQGSVAGKETPTGVPGKYGPADFGSIAGS